MLLCQYVLKFVQDKSKVYQRNVERFEDLATREANINVKSTILLL